MVRVICQIRAHGRKSPAFHANLRAGSGIRGHSLVDVRSVEEIECVAAGAELEDYIRIDGLSPFLDVRKVLRQTLACLFRTGETAGGIVVRRAHIEVLAVHLEAVEVPVFQEHIHQLIGISGGMRIYGRQIPAVPPGDIFVGAVGLHQQHFGMILSKRTFRIGGKRAPPEFGLEAGSVDGIGHTAHAVRPDAGVGLPVAFADLEAVVNVDPLEAELHHLGQGADDLVYRELAFVAPGAPNRFICCFRGDGGGVAVFDPHKLGKGAKRHEEIAAALDLEEAAGAERISRLELDGFGVVFLYSCGC